MLKSIEKKNKKKLAEKQKEWYNTNGKEWKKNYENENKEIINQKSREKYKNDKEYRIKKILRTRFKTTMLEKKKYSSIMNYLGVEIPYLLKWIESQFDKNMNLENQCTYWDIDHVNPCSNFNLNDEEERKKCYSWKNLRPCEKKENYIKNDKIINSLIENHQKLVLNYMIKHPVPS